MWIESKDGKKCCGKGLISHKNTWEAKVRGTEIEEARHRYCLYEEMDFSLYFLFRLGMGIGNGTAEG